MNTPTYACTLGAKAQFNSLSSPTTGTRSHRLAEQSLLQVPFNRTSTRQSHAFSVLGPSVWNSLSLVLWSLPLSIIPSTTQICVIRLRWGWEYFWVFPLKRRYINLCNEFRKL